MLCRICGFCRYLVTFDPYFCYFKRYSLKIICFSKAISGSMTYFTTLKAAQPLPFFELIFFKPKHFDSFLLFSIFPRHLCQMLRLLLFFDIAMLARFVNRDLNSVKLADGMKLRHKTVESFRKTIGNQRHE